MKLPTKNTGILLTMILGAAALGYTFFLFVPSQQALSQVREEISRRQLYVLETSQVQAELQQVEQKLKATQGYAQQQTEALPPSADLSQYTGELTTCATQAGVRIVRFSPQFQQALPPLSRVPVFVSVEGNLEQVFEFTNRLEALPVPIWCQQCTLERDLKNPQLVRAELELLIFASNIEKSG